MRHPTNLYWLLQCELEVHSLGGGVLVVVPREAGNIRIPRQVRPEAGFCKACLLLTWLVRIQHGCP